MNTTKMGESTVKYDILVIGGSAAGVTAAITARRFAPDKAIGLIRKEEKVSIPCGIPYVFGTVGSPEKNLLPDALLASNKIDLVVAQVAGIEPKAHEVALSNGDRLSYGKLILATGSTPVIPPIPGIDKKNVFAAKKEVPYLGSLLEKVNQARNIVIIGGGFIGAEFAEECRKNRDVKVTVVEMLPHCLMLTYDEEFCAMAEGSLRAQGVEVFTCERAAEILGGESVEAVKLGSGKEIPADLVIVGIGATPNTDLARNAGLSTGPAKGIQVDRQMRTGAQDVYACGDCAEKFSFFGGKPSTLRLASIATMEARIAGANACGAARETPGVIGVFSTALGGVAFSAAGLTERAAKEQGLSVVTGQAEAVNRHPGGMPGAANLKVKLVFEKPGGVLLGAEIAGALSGGELINAASVCIFQRMTAEQMATLQVGTHPALTASPVAYQLVNAAEQAITKLRLS